MFSSYGVFPQQTQRMNFLEQQMPNSSFLRGRPVSSIEEVRALPIDFDGSIFYFPDQSKNKIYSKQIGLNGQSIIQMYEKVEIPDPVSESGANMKYVTQDEFNAALQKIVSQLEAMKQEGANQDGAKPTDGYTF